MRIFIQENYQGKYLNGYCNQYYEMVIMDALLRIIQKTHCIGNNSGPYRSIRVTKQFP